MDRERLSELLTSYGATSVFLFIALQIAQVVVSPLPGDVTGLLGGYLYGRSWGSSIPPSGSPSAPGLLLFLPASWGSPSSRGSSGRRQSGNTITSWRQGAGDFLYFLSDPGLSQGHALLYPGSVAHADAELPRHLHDRPAARHNPSVVQGSSLRNDQDVFFFILLGVTALIILGGYFHVGWWLDRFSRRGKDHALPFPLRSHSRRGCRSPRRAAPKASRVDTPLAVLRTGSITLDSRDCAVEWSRLRPLEALARFGGPVRKDLNGRLQGSALRLISSRF